MESVDGTTDALKVSRGSILMANRDREYVNKENTLQIKAGDKIIVGYDGLLHPVNNNKAAITIDNDLEVEGYSATGLSEYLVAWLDSSLDLKENLRRTMLDLDEFKAVIENALVVIGMKREEADRLVNTMTDYDHEFPLIENGFTKEDCHALAKELGLKRPVMYDLGYPNNNCVGCVKGGMGYWNKIRVDFPEVFERRARQEREIGHSCIKGVFLDELDPKRGRMDLEVMEDCGIACQLVLKDREDLKC